ncbi:MAG: LysE family transporter [Candidatus Bathyarchaeia archaeon]
MGLYLLGGNTEIIQLILLALNSFIIGFSGALVPGPLFAVTVSESVRLKRNVGFHIVLGHVFAELVLIAIIVPGLSYILERMEVKIALGIIGGGFLLFTAYGLITYSMKGAGRQIVSNTISTSRNLPALGFLTSFSNPYFTIWWVSIGGLLVAESLTLAGYIGLAVFLASHWCSDLSWYILVSILSYKGSLKFGSKLVKVVMYGCGLFIAILAAYYIIDAVSVLSHVLT